MIRGSSGGDWSRVRDIFQYALDLAPERREPFVVEACEGDENLRVAVLEMLSGHFAQDGSVISHPSPAARASVFNEGDVVGDRFRIVRFLARGGMGEVYEIEDCRLGGRRALKTLRPDTAQTDEALARFRREVTIATDLSHVNLCRVYDLVEHPLLESGGSEWVIPCLTMELLRGESLAEFLAREKPMLPDEALPIIQQIGAGLQALHDAGIVHRDLKPSNIMLSRKRGDGFRVVITDFGLAKSGLEESELYETVTTGLVGAPMFMAPEVLAGKRATFASDVYAFGLIIDEMVTASNAFGAESIQALLYAKLHEQPVPPSARSQNLDPVWEAVILRCLARDPAHRLESPAAVTALLTAGLLPADLPEEPKPVPVPKSPRFRVTKLRVVLAAGLVAIFVAIAAFGRLERPQEIDVYDIENQTGNNKLDYFCQGTTSELLRRLVQTSGLFVVPVHQTRSTAPKKVLGRFLLDATLQSQGGQPRLVVQLADSQSGALLWSGGFDRKVQDDPLGLQTEIARQVSSEVRRQTRTVEKLAGWFPAASGLLNAFFPPPKGPGATTPTRNNLAMDQFMRARYLLDQMSPEATDDAMKALRGAISDDPKFALAWSALGDACLGKMNWQTGLQSDLPAQAETYATQAVNLDPGLAEAHATLAAVQQARWEWEGADLNYREALRLKPRFARAEHWYGGFLLQFGRYSESEAQIRNAERDDPYGLGAPTMMSFYDIFTGQPAEAMHILEPMVAVKDFPGPRSNLAQAYAMLGHQASGAARNEWFRKALEQTEKIADHSGKFRMSDRDLMAAWTRALTYSLEGDARAAAPDIDALTAEMNQGHISPVSIAELHAVLNHRQAALALLETSYQRRDGSLMNVKVDPFLRNLAGEPRFQQIVAAMKL